MGFVYKIFGISLFALVCSTFATTCFEAYIYTAAYLNCGIPFVVGGPLLQKFTSVVELENGKKQTTNYNFSYKIDNGFVKQITMKGNKKGENERKMLYYSDEKSVPSSGSFFVHKESKMNNALVVSQVAYESGTAVESTTMKLQKGLLECEILRESAYATSHQMKKIFMRNDSLFSLTLHFNSETSQWDTAASRITMQYKNDEQKCWQENYDNGPFKGFPSEIEIKDDGPNFTEKLIFDQSENPHPESGIATADTYEWMFVEEEEDESPSVPSGAKRRASVKKKELYDPAGRRYSKNRANLPFRIFF